MSVHVIDHPLVQHKLTIMRDKNTSTSQFRQSLQEISMLMGYEITRDFPLTQIDIETPLQSMKAPTLAGKKVVIANILGQTVANTIIASDNATIAAPAGVVVVKVEGEAAVKAIVK